MARSIADTLRAIAGGEFIDHVSDAMQELVVAVDSTGKGGTLKIEINIKKATKAGAMKLTGKYSLKKPAEEPAEALMFATPEGNLVTEDPRQHKLDLKQVAADTNINLKHVS